MPIHRRTVCFARLLALLALLALGVQPAAMAHGPLAHALHAAAGSAAPVAQPHDRHDRHPPAAPGRQAPAAEACLSLCCLVLAAAPVASFLLFRSLARAEPRCDLATPRAGHAPGIDPPPPKRS
jgi:hypothetical protein